MCNNYVKNVWTRSIIMCSHIQVLIGQQAYLTRQIVLFDVYLSWHAKTQTAFHRNPGWEWNDWTNEQRNSTAVSEIIGFDYALLVMGTYVNTDKITLGQCGVCVTLI